MPTNGRRGCSRPEGGKTGDRLTGDGRLTRTGSYIQPLAMKRDGFDVCVIGTGAGGGVMIDRLTRAGLSVVALQRGPFLQANDFEDDELDAVTHGRVFAPDRLETWRRDELTPAIPGRFNAVADCVGGTLTIWSGLSFRRLPQELKTLSIEGPIAGASLADWPLDYLEIEPFYDEIEREWGVVGDSAGSRFGAPRLTKLAGPLHPPRTASLAVEAGAKALGLHPGPPPLAIASAPSAGRGACLRSGNCYGFGCPVHARASTLSLSIPSALASGRLDLRPNAVARELVYDEGRVKSVRYLDWKGRESEVSASVFVLAAGAIGSPQLLLQSQSGTFPHGLANSSGQVGRNLMLQHMPAVLFLLDRESHGSLGVASHLAIEDFRRGDPKRGFVGGGTLYETNRFTAQPVEWAKAAPYGRPTTEKLWGAELAAFVAEFSRAAAVTAVLEDLPMAENRVDLDPLLKDRFGLAVPRMTHTQHANDIAMHGWFGQRLLELAAASGGETRWLSRIAGGTMIDETTAMPGSPHPMGTCRMGNAKSTAVVDRWCRSHDVANLWIVDASVFPSAGSAPPALTILALAARAAKKLIQRSRRHAAGSREGD